MLTVPCWYATRWLSIMCTTLAGQSIMGIGEMLIILSNRSLLARAAMAIIASSERIALMLMGDTRHVKAQTQSQSLPDLSRKLHLENIVHSVE